VPAAESAIPPSGAVAASARVRATPRPRASAEGRESRAIGVSAELGLTRPFGGSVAFPRSATASFEPSTAFSDSDVFVEPALAGGAPATAALGATFGILGVLIGLIVVVIVVRRRRRRNYRRKGQGLSALTCELTTSDTSMTSTRHDMMTEPRLTFQGPLGDTMTYGATDAEDLEELI
jgi:hypothetical protein